MKKYNYTISGNKYTVTVNKVAETIAEVEVNGTPYQVLTDKPEKEQAVTTKSPEVVKPFVIKRPESVATASGSIKAPLPGVIIHIDCKVGDPVKKGQTLLVLEAMKMENTIPCDRDGVIAEIKVNKGDTVSEGAELVIIK